MKKIIATVAVLMFLLALSAPLAFAQDAGAKPAAQDPAAEEAAAYKAWYDAYTAKDNAKRIELGKAFIAKYPNSKNAAYVKSDIAAARSQLLTAAVQAKNIPEIIRLTKDAMADDPETADYPYFLTVQLQQLDPNFQYAADRTWAAETGIRLLEAGKPFKLYKDVKKNEALAYYHNTLAVTTERDKDLNKALEHTEQAAALDPMNAAYFFACGRLHQIRYKTASDDYLKFPEADRQAQELKPEVKAALDKANAEADEVINCWARFLGLPKNDYNADVKQRVQGALTELYKYRNNGSDAGLQKLIDDNRASPTPVKMTPPVEKPQAAADQKPAGDGNGAKPGSMPPAATAKPGSTPPATPAAKPPVTKKPRM